MHACCPLRCWRKFASTRPPSTRNAIDTNSEPAAAPPSLAVSPALRAVYLTLGWVFLLLGAIGTLLPVLPTTPFLLLTAACWARSSEKFHGWLVSHRVFGPLLRAWAEHRALPYGVKGRAIALVILTIGASAVFGVDNWGLRTMLTVIGLGLVVFLARLPVLPPQPAA